MEKRFVSNYVKSCFMLFFLLAGLFLYAQDARNKPVSFFELSPRCSQIIPNTSGYSYLFHESACGFELKLGVQTTGDKLWQQYHAYPRFGVAFRYMQFSIEEIREKYALFAYLNASILRTPKFSLGYQFGAGVGVYPHPYHKEKNPANRWIGFPVSFYIDLELGAVYRVTKQMDLTAALQFTHSSNGAIRQPNLGLNLFSQQLGVRYYLREHDEKLCLIDSEENKESIEEQNSIMLTIAPSFKQSSRNGRYYFASTLGMSYERQFTPCLKFGAGMDLSYNPGMQSYRTDGVEKGALSYITPAAKASFEVMYGRVALYVAAALYLYRSFDYYLPFYEKAGFKLYLNEKKSQFAGVFVKAHGGSVDYIEWTYGIKLWNWLGS